MLYYLGKNNLGKVCTWWVQEQFILCEPLQGRRRFSEAVSYTVAQAGLEFTRKPRLTASVSQSVGVIGLKAWLYFQCIARPLLRQDMFIM